MKKIVVLLGPPGSGKGTQAKRLSAKLGIPHISTGDLLRENIAKGTELGKKMQVFIDAGKLGPDQIVIDMLFQRLEQPDASKGYLLDGFPRTLAQAEVLDRYLAEKGDQANVLNLNVDEATLIKRISGRLTCKRCGHVHNRFNSPPAKDGVCDLCGGELVQRADDRQEVVEERLRVYTAQTKPLIDYYKKRQNLVDIQGNSEPDLVFKDLLATL